MIDDGSFREDLYYRLNIVPIEVPPLRSRREDIPLLADYFLNHFCNRHHRGEKTISGDAMNALSLANWPGNVRQLRNVIERLVVTVTSDVISVADLPAELFAGTTAKTASTQTLAELTEAAEKEGIRAALAACDFHREQTAKALGISVRTLHYKMNRYGLH
jgi:two-component system NtrC family response regulator